MSRPHDSQLDGHTLDAAITLIEVIAWRPVDHGSNRASQAARERNAWLVPLNKVKGKLQKEKCALVAISLPDALKGKAPQSQGYLAIILRGKDSESAVGVQIGYDVYCPVTAEPSNECRPLRFWGFRFESPSPPGEDGQPSRHNYFHVQPVNNLRGLPKQLASQVCDGLHPSDKEPTFPLPIQLRNSEEEKTALPALLLVALRSLYGADMYKTAVEALDKKKQKKSDFLSDVRSYFHRSGNITLG